MDIRYYQCNQLRLLLIVALVFLSNGFFSRVEAAILDVRISAGSDDAEEYTDSGSVNIDSRDLEMSESNARNRLVGMRFNVINIPKHATITQAYVQFQVNDSDSSAAALTITGEVADNSPTFITAKANISSRAQTNAVVEWIPEPWNITGEAGLNQTTSNIASVIQEIVDQSGWSRGNSLVVIITGRGKRSAESYNGDATAAPLLHVEYTIETETNQALTVDSGADQTINFPAGSSQLDVTLSGTVSVDGRPAASGVITNWVRQSGPGIVVFDDASAVDTVANFDAVGTYVLRLTADDGELSNFDEFSITINAAGTPTSLEVRVTASSDDAEEDMTTGKINRGSSDLELVNQGSFSQIVGIRFNGLMIPQGATITSASLQFKTDETGSESTTLMIEGQAADNALTFSNVNANISTRDRTNAVVDWVPVPWAMVGEGGLAQKTPDITSIIQEIVDRPGWVSGNSLVVIMAGNGRRTAESFEGDPPGAPSLLVTFSTEVIPDLIPYSIGATGPAGGIVFQITNGGLNGLEVAPVDQARARWGCQGTLISGADGTVVGTGAQNTADILAGCTEPGPSIAAKNADSYILNDFADWFLPSRDELGLLWQQEILGCEINSTHCYWSSSERNSQSAWLQNFRSTQQFTSSKNITRRVRAVRVFSATELVPSNNVPTATNVFITDDKGGNAGIGVLLTGNYTYSDTDGDLEGTSTFRWLRNEAAIFGATNLTYTTDSFDADATLTFEVTPAATSGASPGVAVTSSSTNARPTATNLFITDSNDGTWKVGDSLTGNYTYSDAENNLEGATTFRWLRDGVVIAGATSATYTTVLADEGATLTFEVTPEATSGTSPGGSETFLVRMAPYVIGGMGPAGGIVFHLTNDGLSGLEVFPYDQVVIILGVTKSTMKWGCDRTVITGADGIVVGSGAQNTTDILVGCNQRSIAAEIADNTRLNSFSDWFLPSRGALDSIYTNLHNHGLGNFESRDIYWSSTKNNFNGLAWVQSFNGRQISSSKTLNHSVRSIRAFSSVEFPGATPTNAAPSATNVSITDNNGGNVEVGDSLIGQYTYSDAENDIEGTSTVRWLRNGAAIIGATSSTYTTVLADEGVTLTFAVTAEAASGASPGTVVMSQVGVAPYAVGATGPAGGIVFNVSEDGLIGMESAPEDAALAIWHKGCGWSNNETNGFVLGSGAQNTTDIVEGCNAGIAARVADKYMLNGFADWFLPSRDALLLMATNLHNNGLGGFSDSKYWSSTKHIFHTGRFAYAVDFSIDGGSRTERVGLGLLVRPVRAFPSLNTAPFATNVSTTDNNGSN
ncbi:MAG: hypothetical protein V3U88_13075 [Methylococcales bacterium]